MTYPYEIDTNTTEEWGNLALGCTCISHCELAGECWRALGTGVGALADEIDLLWSILLKREGAGAHRLLDEAKRKAQL